ncbi:MAG TPA: hybrid sensor histidine kinase/response regulator, partial [Opitutaceae bacterium]|nr:hybrid sensor histidine kinase/response regulator [Opitutaceae bacterium]
MQADPSAGWMEGLLMLTAEATPSGSDTAAKAAVLVVDDEYGPRESVAFTLSNEFAVETAGSASEGLAKVREKSFAVILLDIRMPEMDGIRGLEELRKIDPYVSVIMLTGYGTLLTAQQAMVGGANQYLRKPPDIDELIEAVRQQARATFQRRHQATLTLEAQQLNVALKKEIESNEPHIWHGRASIELVHDLNNPLTVVIGYATLLIEEARAVARKDSVLGNRLLESAQMVEKAAEYCRHLAENWRRAAKKTTEYGPMDVVQTAQEVRQVIFFGNPQIEISGLPSAPIHGSKFELMRVFQNLFKNSLEAGASTVKVVFEAKDGRIEIAIADNGAGMDPDRVRRVLGGGFTTKENGMGLGLSIIRHLLGAHGATFQMESQVGQGTTIRL